jgi:hypothetical protein
MEPRLLNQLNGGIYSEKSSLNTSYVAGIKEIFR